MRAKTIRRPRLPACAKTFLAKCTRQRCQAVENTFPTSRRGPHAHARNARGLDDQSPRRLPGNIFLQPRSAICAHPPSIAPLWRAGAKPRLQMTATSSRARPVRPGRGTVIWPTSSRRCLHGAGCAQHPRRTRFRRHGWRTSLANCSRRMITSHCARMATSTRGRPLTNSWPLSRASYFNDEPGGWCRSAETSSGTATAGSFGSASWQSQTSGLGGFLACR
ncbi:hypothetical protein BN1110_03722 [bacterium YEK0313]|nr:hypothetical protein BN1110_03722 [bacterium YEK0313]